MVGENRLIETMKNLNDQVVNGTITPDKADFDFGRAIVRYGDCNAIIGGLIGIGSMAVAEIAIEVFIKPTTKKLITKFKNKKNSKLKVEEKEQA